MTTLTEVDRRYLETWAGLWDVPDLPDKVTIDFNPRLRTSLGRCSPQSRSIALHPALRDGDPDLRAQVLCHEFAHLAVWELHGPQAAPHGTEWRRLVEVAGYDPSVRLDGRGEVPESRAEPPEHRYRHTCPVCHFSRTARRPVANWRCPECRAAGMEGRLRISSQGKSCR